MPQIQKEALIHASCSVIFRALTDPTKVRVLNPNLRVKSYRKSPLGGVDWEFDYSVAGLTVSGTSECTEYRRPRHLVMKTSGGLVSRWEWRLADEKPSTCVTLVLNYLVPPVAAAIPFGSALLDRHNRHAIEALFQNLKHVTERSSPADASAAS